MFASIGAAQQFMFALATVVYAPAAPAPVESREPLPRVATDRPDVANSTITMAPGVWQLELGLDATVYSRRPPDGLPLGVPSSLRIGVHRRVEVRAFDGDPVPLLEGGNRDTGGLSFGIKARFNDPVPGTRIPSFGLQLYGVRSLGRRGLRPPAFGAVVIWTQQLVDWFFFDLNLGAEVVPIDDYHQASVTSLAAFSGVFDVHHRIDPYMEVYGLLGRAISGGGLLGADAGLILKVTRRIAIDVAARTGLLAHHRDVGVMAGITWLLADGSQRRRRHASLVRVP